MADYFQGGILIMGTTFTESKQIMKGDKLKIIFLVYGAKLEGGHPTEVTHNVVDTVREFVSARYELMISLTGLLGIKVDKDFVPNEGQIETIMAKIMEWFTPLNEKVEEEIRLSLDNWSSIVIATINNKSEDGLTWQDILDAIK